MAFPSCDVVVIGSANMDMTVRCKHLPIPGQTILGDSFVTNPGGKGANQAFAAALWRRDDATCGARGQRNVRAALHRKLRARRNAPRLFDS